MITITKKNRIKYRLFFLIKTITLLLILLGFTQAKAQIIDTTNYVLNGGLEKYSECPFTVDQIRFADHWSPIDTFILDPVGTPEYCNVCAPYSSGVNIPNGVTYFHAARSGNGMAQLQMYSDETSVPTYKRDYLQGRLSKTLESGKVYCVTFYATLEYGSLYAINNIGAYLDNGSIDNEQDSISSAQPQTQITPQILKNTTVTDSINFVKVQGLIVGTGHESFVTIGNFFDKDHTTAISTVPSPIYGGFTWYLIDDISVVDSSMIAYAGPNKRGPIGDSVFIGCHQDGLPCTWYKVGSSTPISYASGLYVPVDEAPTQYVVMLDLYHHVTYDTVTVSASGVGVPLDKLTKANRPVLYPNPANNLLTIENAAGSEVKIYDLIGQEVMFSDKLRMISDKEVIHLDKILPGSYIVQLTDAEGWKENFRVVKE